MKTEMKDDGVQKKRGEHGFLYYFYPGAPNVGATVCASGRKIVRIVKSIVLRKGAQTQMVRSRQAGTKNTGKTDFTHGKRGVQ